MNSRRPRVPVSPSDIFIDNYQAVLYTSRNRDSEGQAALRPSVASIPVTDVKPKLFKKYNIQEKTS